MRGERKKAGRTESNREKRGKKEVRVSESWMEGKPTGGRKERRAEMRRIERREI